jgi:hypothetical protein
MLDVPDGTRFAALFNEVPFGREPRSEYPTFVLNGACG